MIRVKLRIEDTKNNYISTFDSDTGYYTREPIVDNGADAFMASFPELIDIGIMGHCAHGLSGKCSETGIKCYQHGDVSKKRNMFIGDYKSIIDECRGNTYQVALGGCGDPDMHEDFEEILRYTVENNIVPNFTTSGFGMTAEKAKICKKYCGAVAVSMYSRLRKDSLTGQFDGKEELGDNESNYTLSTVKMLVDAGVTTNIHFVLSNSTIDEAIYRLKNDKFPNGINAVIFLLHKPVGLGDRADMIRYGDKRLEEFLSLIDRDEFRYQIGFDSCTVPAILNLMGNIDLDSLDTCEAARWSMYITPDMKGLPCSFDNQALKYAVDIKEAGGIREVWNSLKFEEIRNKFRGACRGCKKREHCLGGCPLMSEIVLCKDIERG